MFATGAIIHSTCLRFGSIFFLKYIFNIQQQQQQQRQQLGNNESKKKVHDFNFLFFFVFISIIIENNRLISQLLMNEISNERK